NRLGAAEAKRIHQVDQTGLKSRNGRAHAPCVCYRWGAAQVAPPPRFRTIQVCPKDLASLWGRLSVAVNRSTDARGGLRHETPGVLHAARRRGGVAARGAGAEQCGVNLKGK